MVKTTLIGGEGADILDGGGGDVNFDLAVYSDSQEGVVIDMATGRGFGGTAQGDRLISIERIIGSNHNDTLMGDASGDDFRAAAGNDTLKGFGGDDFLSGEDGDDTLKGAGGADSLLGGAGSDTAAYQDSPTRVFVSLLNNTARFGDAEGDILKSIENVTGSAFNDDLRGNDGVNALNGMAGNDRLDGFGGNDTLLGDGGDDVMDGGTDADTMAGGRGNDVFFVENVNDRVTERAGGGVDVVLTSVGYSLSTDAEVETLKTVDPNGTDAIFLFGSSIGNTIIGNDGSNFISGGGGVDHMTGRGGNDSYIVDNAGDIVVETTGQGIDTVNTLVNYTLGAGVAVETLQIVSVPDGLRLTGNELANTVIGNAGNDVLDGSGGVDTLAGQSGNDSFFVDNAADKIVERSGVDTVNASVSYTLEAGVAVETLRTDFDGDTTALRLTGNELANTVIGNAGNNVLNGGGGVDTLQGLDGNDAYFVDNAADKIVESGGIDSVNASVSYTLAVGRRGRDAAHDQCQGHRRHQPGRQRIPQHRHWQRRQQRSQRRRRCRYPAGPGGQRCVLRRPCGGPHRRKRRHRQCERLGELHARRRRGGRNPADQRRGRHRCDQTDGQRTRQHRHRQRGIQRRQRRTG